MPQLTLRLRFMIQTAAKDVLLPWQQFIDKKINKQHYPSTSTVRISDKLIDLISVRNLVNYSRKLTIAIFNILQMKTLVSHLKVW